MQSPFAAQIQVSATSAFGKKPVFYPRRAQPQRISNRKSLRVGQMGKNIPRSAGAAQAGRILGEDGKLVCR
jgi:hypothetical protein